MLLGCFFVYCSSFSCLPSLVAGRDGEDAGYASSLPASLSLDFIHVICLFCLGKQFLFPTLDFEKLNAVKKVIGLNLIENTSI